MSGVSSSIWNLIRLESASASSEDLKEGFALKRRRKLMDERLAKYDVVFLLVLLYFVLLFLFCFLFRID